MMFRSLFACTVLSGLVLAGDVSAQVVLCPQSPSSDVVSADVSAEAEQLLKRLTIALDLHGHRGISEGDIMNAHAATPSALLAKLTDVANRCLLMSGDVEGFYQGLPDLRKAFLEATAVIGDAEIADESEQDPRVQAAGLAVSEAERVEQSIGLSIREIWRKLWFRPAGQEGAENDRWAVIVASPIDADSGWDALGKHQRRWKDAYFQLHEPYYDSNPHHAIVVGRRLPQRQANKLLDYVIELGMAEDAFLWPLPETHQATVDRTTAAASAESDDLGRTREDGRLDLSILDRR